MWPQAKIKPLMVLPLLGLLISSTASAMSLSELSNSEDLQQLRNIEASIDLNVDPCDNFYGYACGKWPQMHPSAVETDMEAVIRYKHVLSYIGVIAKAYPSMSETKKHNQNFTDKALTYFYSCHTKSTELSVWKYLNEIKPGPGLEWPMVAAMNAHRRHERNLFQRPWPLGQFDLFALLGQLNSYGFTNEFIRQTKITVNGRPSIALGVPTAQVINRETVAGVLKDTGLPPRVARKYLKEIVADHNQLQAFYKNYTQTENADKTEYTIPYAGLKHDIPHLYTFVDKIMPQRLRQPGDAVTVSDVDYFTLLVARIRNPYELQRICTYLMVKFLMYLKYQNPNCYYIIENRMHLAFDYMYYKHQYQPQAQELNDSISKLTKRIYKYLLETLNENRLDLDVDQLQVAKGRLYNITSNIGNLPQQVGKATLEEFYRHLPDMDIDNFYRNDLLALQHQVLEFVTCPPKMLCDREFPAMPRHETADNFVVIPFASLTPPLYHIDLDPLLSLSSFGSLLGHEFTHAVDGGSLQMSGPLFEKIMQHPSIRCLQHQAPTKFIDERVADLVGARVAFRAYSQEYKYNLQPSFTSIPWNKLFFLNLAQVFCTKEDGRGSEHDSAMTRLNQVAKNLDVFSEAFQCPMGSNMNPARKCRFH